MALDQKTFGITPAYDILLRGMSDMPIGLFHLQMATAEQLCRLHYSPNSVKAVKAKLRKLYFEGYVQYDAIPTKFTRSPYYYTLDRLGVRYLQDVGIDINEAFRVDKEVNRHALFIEHTLEINDIIISAALLERSAPGYWLESFIHERTLKKKPYKTDWQGGSFALIPDGFLTFRSVIADGRQRRLPIILEHDRGTEEQQHFRKRIRAYIVFLHNEGYKDMFGVGGVTIAFTTSVGTNRLLKMQEWTLKELAATNESLAIGHTFYFTCFDKTIDPYDLWVRSSWFKVDENQPTSLLGEV